MSERLHLVADDLTGALDSAAQFVRPGVPIDVFWRPAASAGSSFALAMGTREATARDAERTLTACLATLPRDPTALRFAKLDSLLRGHPAATVAGWFRLGGFEHCLVAPAFPHQGRITRGSRQRRRLDGGHWEELAVDLAAELEHLGVRVTRRRAGEAAAPGVTLWDAETDADLAAIVRAGRALQGPVLWSGSAGLAGALAGAAPAPPGLPWPLPRPVLGLFGTDHPATVAQLDACGPQVVTLPRGDDAVARRLNAHGVALTRVEVPQGTPRAEAARAVDRELAALVLRLPPPATLLVAGGETLRGLCVALGADHLELTGQLEPGIPCSVLRRGRYDGVRVVSKSGAFGAPDLLGRLLAPAPCQGGAPP